MTPLERSAAFWLRAYPRRWRERRSAEITAVVADLAPHDASRVDVRTALGLVRAGWQTRRRDHPPLGTYLAHRFADRPLPPAYDGWVRDDRAGRFSAVRVQVVNLVLASPLLVGLYFLRFRAGWVGAIAATTIWVALSLALKAVRAQARREKIAYRVLAAEREIERWNSWGDDEPEADARRSAAPRRVGRRVMDPKFERSVHRYLRAYPRRWRLAKEAEVTAVLADLAGPGATRLDLRSAVGLVLSGSRTRHRERPPCTCLRPTDCSTGGCLRGTAPGSVTTSTALCTPCAPRRGALLPAFSSSCWSPGRSTREAVPLDVHDLSWSPRHSLYGPSWRRQAPRPAPRPGRGRAVDAVEPRARMGHARPPACATAARLAVRRDGGRRGDRDRRSASGGRWSSNRSPWPWESAVACLTVRRLRRLVPLRREQGARRLVELGPRRIAIVVVFAGLSVVLRRGADHVCGARLVRRAGAGPCPRRRPPRGGTRTRRPGDLGRLADRRHG